MFKFWLSCWLLCGMSLAAAEEVITRFHSDVVIAANGQITVTETITVRAEGQAIRRGIFRDFPTQYFGTWYTIKEVGFEVLSVHRNNQAEPHHTERLSNGIRLYIGSGHRFIEPGIHTYQIQYQTDKQLGYFDTYDEFYWNVTGTGWQFPILHASIHIKLPHNDPTVVTDQQAWTGYQGQQLTHYQITNAADYLGFETTQPLAPNQGLTIGIQFPKGILDVPAVDWLGFISSNLVWLLAVLVVLIYMVFYLSAWLRHGRDPEKGVIMVRFYPPKNLSPAAVHYIDREQINDQTLTACLISLAVKGHLQITQLKKQYRLKKTDAKTKLSTGEKAVKKHLFSSRSSKVTISKQYQSSVAAAKKQLDSTLKNEYQRQCFVDNSFYVWWAWVISLLCFFLVTLTLYNQTLTVANLLVFIFGWGIVSLIVLGFMLTAPIFFGVILLIALAGSYLDLIELVRNNQPWLYFCLFLLGLNFLFGYLMRAPTPFGRHLKDQIDGLKLYMKAAEEQRLKLLNPPEKTSAHYEALLPYAVALGLENQWAEQFVTQLNTKDDQTSTTLNYQPGWFTAEHPSTTFTSSAMPRFSHGLSSTLRSAATIPSARKSSSSGSYSSRSSGSYSSSSSSSSSSGSSGSSGGGGGGGGGGGW